eukprot:747895-Hanusia_phi.AAC.5
MDVAIPAIVKESGSRSSHPLSSPHGDQAKGREGRRGGWRGGGSASRYHIPGKELVQGGGHSKRQENERRGM